MTRIPPFRSELTVRTISSFVLSGALLVALVGCGASAGSDDAATTTTTTSVPEVTTTTGSATTTEPSGGEPTALPTRDEYVAALVENLSGGSEDDLQLVVDRSQAECIAPKWVDAITVDLLHENEVTVEELSDPAFKGSGLGMDRSQGAAMVAAFGGCDVDLVALFTAALTQGLTPEQQACVATKADPALVEDLLAATFSTGEADAELLAVQDQLTSVCELPGG